MGTEENTIIESIGTYLPPDARSTQEILEGCKTKFRFPLEKITGIKSRRMAGQKEFAIDLSIKAVEKCLNNSKYHPSEIDLIICCNISRFDEPHKFSYEPCTSIKLKKKFGMQNALAFDITNACAGMFTGIYLAKSLLNTGAIKRAMVVSGEYITHLTQSAQREIENYMDSRMACLTLGDAGAAIILEKSNNSNVGFLDLDLQTFGHYSQFCIAKTSSQGGWIMLTDAVNLTDAGIKSGAINALSVLKRAGWYPDKFDKLILHQTSRMSLNSAKNEINNLFNETILDEENTFNNLEERGNTASTSHFIALDDLIREQKIKPGEKIVFGISASGLTTGTALYVLDDLPERMRMANKDDQKKQTKHVLPPKPIPNNQSALPKIKIAGIGTVSENNLENWDSLEMVQKAASKCIENSSYLQEDINLLIHAGTYRTENILEPAYATLLAGKLNMNASLANLGGKKTFAFDIFNGANGFLQACYISQQLIGCGEANTAMITAVEAENNKDQFPNDLLGIKEVASAVILEKDPEGKQGFSRFLFNYHLNQLEKYTTFCSTEFKTPSLSIQKDPDLEEIYLSIISEAVYEILRQESKGLQDVHWFFPPQISSNFIKKLSAILGLPIERFIDVADIGPDLFSSSIPFGLKSSQSADKVKSGELGLMISVGSGIQVSCALYHF